MSADRMKRLLERREAVNAQIRQAQNRVKAGERKSETRRKILAGAAVLQRAAKDNDFSAMLMKELQAFLVRDADRALFGLQPLEKPENAEREAA